MPSPTVTRDTEIVLVQKRDRLLLDGKEGVVEAVGCRTTRLPKR
jgi:hypothetical protein